MAMKTHQTVYCVIEDGDYGTWHKNPMDYDAVYRDRSRAEAHAKEFEHGHVHAAELRSYDGGEAVWYVFT